MAENNLMYTGAYLGFIRFKPPKAIRPYVLLEKPQTLGKCYKIQCKPRTHINSFMTTPMAVHVYELAVYYSAQLAGQSRPDCAQRNKIRGNIGYW